MQLQEYYSNFCRKNSKLQPYRSEHTTGTDFWSVRHIPIIWSSQIISSIDENKIGLLPVPIGIWFWNKCTQKTSSIKRVNLACILLPYTITKIKQDSVSETQHTQNHSHTNTHPSKVVERCQFFRIGDVLCWIYYLKLNPMDKWKCELFWA